MYEYHRVPFPRAHRFNCQIVTSPPPRIHRRARMAHRYAAGDESPVTATRSTIEESSPPGSQPRASRANTPTSKDFHLDEHRTKSVASPIDTIWDASANRPQASHKQSVSASMRALSDIGNVSLGNASLESPRRDRAPDAVDVPSYLLGQKHALETAFDNALPQRQLLGALQLALHDVRAKTNELERLTSDVSKDVRKLDGRETVIDANVRALTSMTIPALQQAIGELRSRVDQAERTKGLTFKDLLKETALRALFGVSRVETVVGSWTRDVLFSQTKEYRDDSSAEVLALDPPTPAYVQALGAFLLIAAVELASAANEVIKDRAPTRFRRSTTTMSYGINACRALVWFSAFAQGFTATKHTCHAFALGAYKTIAARRKDKESEPEDVDSSEDSTAPFGAHQ